MLSKIVILALPQLSETARCTYLLIGRKFRQSRLVLQNYLELGYLKDNTTAAHSVDSDIF